MNKFNEEKCKEAVKMLLESFGEDVNREGLKETPRRVAGYWKELLEGNNYTNQEIAEKYNKVFHLEFLFISSNLCYCVFFLDHKNYRSVTICCYHKIQAY